MAEKTEQYIVKKASAATQMQNAIPLFARRVWTALLYNAYNHLLDTSIHTISVKSLKDLLEYDSHNNEYLKEALTILATYKLQWNVLGKDKEWEWGVSALLAGAEIKRSLCSYSFSPQLAHRLHNPRLYARISLSIQNKFKSKHSLALWELCLDYLNEYKNYGETPYILIPTFRQLLGIEEGQYKAFKLLNSKVIKGPVSEINQKTDFQIEVEYRRKGQKSRTIEAVKFRFRRVSIVFDEHEKQAALFDDNENDIPPIVKELRSAGVSFEAAWEIWHQGFNQVESDTCPRGIEFESYVREKIELLKQSRPKNVRNAAGFLIGAIRKNWQSTKQAAKTKATVKRTPKEVASPPTPEPASDQETNHIAGIIRQFPEVLEAAFDPEAIQKEQPFLLQQYRQDLREQSALWNYENHPPLAAYAEAQVRDLFLSGRAFKEGKQVDHT